jgi:hypothetical protein
VKLIVGGRWWCKTMFFYATPAGNDDDTPPQGLTTSKGLIPCHPLNH